MKKQPAKTPSAVPRGDAEKILILDFGSQYTQLIARRIREAHVYSEIVDSEISLAEIKKFAPKGIILSGSPFSVHNPKCPKFDPGLYTLGIPVLGICYGQQLTVHSMGGQVQRSGSREYGPAILKITKKDDPFFAGVPVTSPIWMSHADEVVKIPKCFETIAVTDSIGYAAICDRKRQIWGIQFHPEVVHSKYGSKMLYNFARKICGCKGRWTAHAYVDIAVAQIRKQVGKDHVILGLSGGVDSTVAAVLLHKAIGNQLTCVFVDNGLLRQDEAKKLLEMFKRHIKLKVIFADEGKEFLSRLAGVSEPEKKRKIIGHYFVEVFRVEAKKIKNAKFLAQGTTYPDVIESSGIGKHADNIKSHHNVGGLPAQLGFKDLVEPLRMLFKDEVRALGKELGLDDDFVWRHPFPGPGLAVRILGDITEEKVTLLQKADAIVMEEIKAAGWYRKTWQAFAVLLPIQSVGVMGDERTYERSVAIRCVSSVDGMTADWVPLPHDVLRKISTRITNEVRGINRVVYDITSKPPSTIEWE